jgi:hypothetical protein
LLTAADVRAPGRHVREVVVERFATRLVEVWEQSAEIVEQNVAEILEERLRVNSQVMCAGRVRDSTLPGP